MTIFAFTLVLSAMLFPPKPGSDMVEEEPQPTTHKRALVTAGLVEGVNCSGRTASEEAVFGEDCYGVDEENGHWI